MQFLNGFSADEFDSSSTLSPSINLVYTQEVIGNIRHILPGRGDHRYIGFVYRFADLAF